MIAAYGALRAGAAAVDVTPPPGAWLAGYGRGRKANGAHDPLWARALAFSVGEARAVLVAVDCIGLFAPDIARVAAELDLPAEAVFVGATHTHSGPDTLGLWGPREEVSGVDEPVLDAILAGARQAAGEALDALRPAHLTLATTNAPVRCAVNVRDPISLDTRISVLRLADAGGAGLATLANWACHPETLRNANHLYSSDLAHALRLRLEDSLGGVALFFNGALGAMVTVDTAEDTFDEAARIGQAVADEAAAAILAEPASTDWLTLDLAREEVTLPMDNPAWRAASHAGVVRRPLNADGEVTTHVSALCLGNATLLTAPGELQPSLGRRWKRLMVRPTRFLLGLTGDELGYVLGRADYELERYAYERSMSLGPETAGRLTSAAQRVLRAVRG